jgi:hypothetical protein
MMKALLLSLAGTAAASTDGNFLQVNLGVDHNSQGLVRSLEFKHRLRVCNAYPNAGSLLDVYRGGTEKFNDSPLPYKSCKDFSSELKSGDKLDFKVGEAAQGSFSISELPENDAVLLLVVRRHDEKSSSVAFDSHIFANVEGVQLAVIDTYKGKERATARIKDSNHTKSEELHYNAVVAVKEGKYDLELDDQEGRKRAKHSFVALNHESYVVLRTGAGEAFPEELVVFPQSDPARLPHSGASTMTARAAGFAVLAVLAYIF